MARRPSNFCPVLPKDLTARSEELLEYPLRSKTRLSPPQEKDEMIQPLLQPMLQLQDCLVEVVAQLVEDFELQAKQPALDRLELKTLALTRRS